MEAQRRHGAPSESERDSRGLSSSDSSGFSSQDEIGRPSQSIKEPHARWTTTYDIELANALVQQILHGKTTKNGFSKKTWSLIRTGFNRKTGCNYTHQQIRNRKGALKTQYKVVKQLLGLPGFKWDETRHMVTAEDAVWDDYLKANPDAEKFRMLRFPVYDQFSIISGDVGAKLRLGKSSQPPSLEVSTPDDTRQSAQEQFDTDEPALAMVSVQDKDSAYLARDPEIIQRCNKRQLMKPSGPDHQRRRESNSSDLAEAFFEFADALRCKTHASASTGDPYAISKCIKELESIKGVTDEDVFGAIDVFKDPLLREAFLTMQPQRRLRWIRTQLK
ncbi:L10-interacting MYB domain-containing protein-like [Telopea speciosissima]|uniref:L10-interacting MYB domain-containing protein-like n=1 Tax=Telopea speciosissima TaxID=54955 RepID=UPI001CC4F26E|nr:L10-interacting MYB domain-containing protein-like [Telopea speciosissima]